MKKTILFATAAAAFMFGFESEGMNAIRSDVHGAGVISSSPTVDIFSFKLNETDEKFEVQKTGENLVFKNESLLSSVFSNFKDGERPIIEKNMRREKVADIIVSFFGKDEVTFLGGRDLPSEDPFSKLGKVVATKTFYRPFINVELIHLFKK
jgi:hypothetical protein